MKDLLSETLATQRIEVALLGAMAGLALLLSAVGIFALVASMVAQRTREIGIRIALGSSVRQAMAHIGAPAARASALGLAAGLIACLGALRIMRSVLYGVGVYDAPNPRGRGAHVSSGHAPGRRRACPPHRQNRSGRDSARRIGEAAALNLRHGPI